MAENSVIPDAPLDQAQLARRFRVMEAVARGWCADANAHKVFDMELAKAIVDEIMKLDRVDQHAFFESRRLRVEWVDERIE